VQINGEENVKKKEKRWRKGGEDTSIVGDQPRAL